MTQTTIYKVLGIQGMTMMLFYTEAQCWQFRVNSAGGGVFGGLCCKKPGR